MIVFVFLLLLMISASACSRFEADENTKMIAAAKVATVWVASPWQQVLRSTAPKNLTEVKIKAASNEYEPFRIIIHAGQLPLSGVNATSSSLVSSIGEIPAGNIRLFRANYLNITKPSYRSKSPADWYPDALIPFKSLSIPGKSYVAAPFNIEKWRNGEIWCDLFVPPGTIPGIYTGTVTISAEKVILAKVPVELTVWNFELPVKIAMLSYFGKLRSESASMMGIKSGTEDFRAMEKIYNKVLLEHRAMPSTPSDVWPAWNETDGIIENGETGRMRSLVEEDHFNVLDIPFRYRDDPVKCKSFLTAIANWLRNLGYLDKAYIYLEDEPNNALEYEIVRNQGALIKSADPGIGRLCTEQTVSSNPAWGDLYGAVDIWCPLWGLWDEPTARMRLANGEKLWSYTALCQGPDGTPWWQIDMDPLNFRSPMWLSWHYDITGFLYWTSTYWSSYINMQGVWEAPNFRPENGFWGEGMLLYPGYPAGINGFVPSIRLKLIREAMEDYEYMSLAAKLGKGAEVDIIVNELVTSFQVWSRELGAYDQARDRLADLIINSK